RTEIAMEYLSGLSDIDSLDLPGFPPYEHTHSWHLFVVKVNSMERKDFMEALAEHNIGYGLHFPACHTLRFVKQLFGETRLPVTEEASEKILSLPLYPGMEKDQVHRVIEAVRGILR
ncbi:MAG: DegT/DnrJ/EryC1/StrS family aminotransferase, partial [Desulfomonilia bacterium]